MYIQLYRWTVEFMQFAQFSYNIQPTVCFYYSVAYTYTLMYNVISIVCMYIRTYYDLLAHPSDMCIHMYAKTHCLYDATR